MALDFEKFLNEALEDSDDKKKNSFLTNPEEDKETVNPIDISTIMSQIDQLKEQALSSPELFKEVYEKLDEFEEDLPQYLHDIQSKFYETQSELKEKHLRELSQSHTQKLQVLEEFFKDRFFKINHYLDHINFEMAHATLREVGEEITQIPISHSKIKKVYAQEYYNLLNTYYMKLAEEKNDIGITIAQKVEQIINNKLVFKTHSIEKVNEFLEVVEALLFSKRIELETSLFTSYSKLNGFYSELLMYRESLLNRYETEFKTMFEKLQLKVQEYINDSNVLKCLITLEMLHILLRRVTKYDQGLKIEYFIKILENKKKLYELSAKERKSLSQKELTLAHYHSKIQLVSLVSENIFAYSISEISDFIKEIQSNNYLNTHEQDSFIQKLQTQIKNIELKISEQKIKISNIEKQKKIEDVTHNRFEVMNTKLNELFNSLEEEQNEALKHKKKIILKAYIKKFIKKEKQESLLTKLEGM